MQHTETKKEERRAIMAHLEDKPGRAAVNSQRLVQRTVERGAVAPKLTPELLLPLGVSKRQGILHGPPTWAGRPAWEDEASASCPRSPTIM
jgi:hypothetical protein